MRIYRCNFSGAPDGIPSRTHGNRDADCEEFVRWLRELKEERRNKAASLCQPFLKTKALVEDWKRGEFIFHLKVGIRPHLASREACDFCADLKYAPLRTLRHLSDLTVPRVRDFVGKSVGQEEDWLDRAVLVSVVERRKDSQV